MEGSFFYANGYASPFSDSAFLLFKKRAARCKTVAAYRPPLRNHASRACFSYRGQRPLVVLWIHRHQFHPQPHYHRAQTICYPYLHGNY